MTVLRRCVLSAAASIRLGQGEAHRSVSSLTRRRARAAAAACPKTSASPYVSSDPDIFESQVAVFGYNEPAERRQGAWRAKKAMEGTETQETLVRRWTPERIETTRKRLKRFILNNKGDSLTSKSIAFTSAELLRFTEGYFAEWQKQLIRERKGRMTAAKGKGKRSGGK